MSDGKKREVRRVAAKGWGGLALAGMAMGLAVAPVAHAASAVAGQTGLAPAGAESLWLAAGTEGGEGGEGGAAAVAPDATVDLMESLYKIEARALTAVDLAAAGDGKAAEATVESAREKVFENIEDALTKRKAPMFEEALVDLGMEVAKGTDATAVSEAQDRLAAGIEKARAQIAPTPREELAAMLALTRDAAEDFGKGVKDGALADAGEYRDARGYLKAVRAALARLSGSADPVVKEAADKSAAALDPVIAAMGEVAPQGPIKADQQMILAAAARIELASYPVK